jgi:hypothetical protein
VTDADKLAAATTERLRYEFARVRVSTLLDIFVGDGALVTAWNYSRCPHCDYGHQVRWLATLETQHLRECVRCGAAWTVDEMEGPGCPF